MALFLILQVVFNALIFLIFLPFVLLLYFLQEKQTIFKQELLGMKKIIGILSLVLILVTGVSANQEMILEGTYQGENLYVQNPFASSGVGFCVTNVLINGQQSIDEINSSAFEIDFSSYQLTKGAAVKIKIEYKDDCTPRVLNPEVLKASSTFVIAQMNITADGLFTFSTTNESGKLPYVIEQKRWNKWIKVATVDGKGSAGKNDYSIQLKPHSGKNIYRIKQVDYTRTPRYSPEKKLIRSSVEEVFIANENLLRIEGVVNFADKSGNEVSTLYEVYNTTGVIVRKGFGAKVNLSDLKKGDYFVMYDNKMGQIKKI